MGTEVVQLIGAVNEQAGRDRISGFFQRSHEAQCDGTPQRWTATVRSDNASFGGGKASVVVMGISCNRLQCAQEYSDQAVRLRGGPR